MRGTNAHAFSSDENHIKNDANDKAMAAHRSHLQAKLVEYINLKNQIDSKLHVKYFQEIPDLKQIYEHFLHAMKTPLNDLEKKTKAIFQEYKKFVQLHAKDDVINARKITSEYWRLYYQAIHFNCIERYIFLISVRWNDILFASSVFKSKFGFR